MNWWWTINQLIKNHDLMKKNHDEWMKKQHYDLKKHERSITITIWRSAMEEAPWLWSRFWSIKHSSITIGEAPASWLKKHHNHNFEAPQSTILKKHHAIIMITILKKYHATITWYWRSTMITILKKHHDLPRFDEEKWIIKRWKYC